MIRTHEYKDSVIGEISADYQQRRVELSWITVLILTVLTMLMLTAGQEPLGWSALTWVSLVPWVVAVVGAKKGGWIALISYLAGFLYFMGNLYWLVWVTVPGWITLCFYLAWYFVLCGFIIRQVYLKWRRPFTLVLPVVWVGQEYLRGILLTGFPWFFLSHSQHENMRLLQICDLFGAYGMTFLIAMVNGLICDILLRPLRQDQAEQKKALLGAGPLFMLTFCCVMGAFFYGRYRLDQGKETIKEDSVISVIQEAIPQYVKESGESTEEIFSRHLTLTQEALAAPVRPDLVVWPETMAASPLNKEFIELDEPSFDLSSYEPLYTSRAFDTQLRELCGRDVALLVGAPSVQMVRDGLVLKPDNTANSAILYLPGGRRFDQRYDKMHLVPFGEVVPFKKSWPWLYRQLNRLTPYDYEYSLEAGENPTIFEFVDRMDRTVRFGVAICYEDVMPQVPRRLASLEAGRKRIDFLLNISNDGWFVRADMSTGVITPSAELMQHLVICKFRAVENRIGIARAVNTGISAFIRPDGVVQKHGLSGTLPAELRQREGMVGFLTDKIYVDSRVTLYSRTGDIFAMVCTLLTGLMFILVIVIKKKPAPENPDQL
ncbi:MAG: apolipoprotein N-acyltransferase [Sedimentisphaerales bacterium]|nr:apolipoprotein N-acyltransferase [Sedimentisphaerales bacterium]